MSDEKEVGVFTTTIAITKQGLDKYTETKEFFIYPVFYEFLHKVQKTIHEEGIYQFTLTVTKLK